MKVVFGAAVAAVAILVIVATFGIVTGNSQTVRDGPPISIQAIGVGMPPGQAAGQAIRAPLSGVSVVISSVNPIEAMGGNILAAPGSSGVINLFSASTNANGIAAGSLSSQFLPLAREWTHLVPGTARVSLMLAATYQMPVGSVADVYVVHDSIPYDPGTPLAPLNALVQIDLSNPSYVTPNPVGAQAVSTEVVPLCVREPSGQCEPQCPKTSITTDVINTTYATGPFPLAMAENDDPSNPDYLDMGLFTIDQTEQFGFTGASFTQGDSYTDYGTGTSFSESGIYTQLAAGTVTATSSSSTSVGILYVNNVTLFSENSRSKEVYYTGTPPNCVEHINYGPIVTQVEISGIQQVGNGIAIYSQTLPATWGQFITKVLDLVPAGSSIALSAGQSYNFLTGQFLATGYSNMNTEVSAAVGALSYFSAALGMGLAIIDAADLCPFDACAAVQLGETLGLISAAVGLGTSILQAFTTISWSETLSTSLQDEVITNDQVGAGATMDITFYQSGNDETYAELSSGSYAADMPTPFVVGTQ